MRKSEAVGRKRALSVDIWQMNDSVLEDGTRGHERRRHRRRIDSGHVWSIGMLMLNPDQMNEVTLAPIDGRQSTVAYRHRATDDGVVYGPGVGRHAGDHPQDLRRRGLALERVRQLAVARLELPQ